MIAIATAAREDEGEMKLAEVKCKLVVECGEVDRCCHGRRAKPCTTQGEVGKSGGNMEGVVGIRLDEFRGRDG